MKRQTTYDGKCVVADCDTPYKALGFCPKHYARQHYRNKHAQRIWEEADPYVYWTRDTDQIDPAKATAYLQAELEAMTVPTLGQAKKRGNSNV